MELLDVTLETMPKSGFFCMMSKKKSDGYKQKAAWLEARFAEGLRLRMLDPKQGGRGFIEYLPGEWAWRAVHASGYMFIHCLWVVGTCKGKGYAKMLLESCLDDARRAGMKGVAMVTSEGNWLLSKKFLLLQGFESADAAPPAFNLMVKRFNENAALPHFPTDWEDRAKAFGDGLTIVRTGQCPYLADAERIAGDAAAAAAGMPFRTVFLESAEEVRRRAPSPYGVFATVLNGRLLASHYLLPKEIGPLLQPRIVPEKS